MNIQSILPGDEIELSRELIVTVHATKHTTFDRDLIKAYYTELKEIAAATAPDAKTDLLAQVLRLPDVSTTASEMAIELLEQVKIARPRERRSPPRSRRP